MDELVEMCLDLGQWKHSWHNDFKELEDYEKARDVIIKKIQSRIKDLQLLNDGLNKIDCIIARERECLAMDKGSKTTNAGGNTLDNQKQRV